MYIIPVCGGLYTGANIIIFTFSLCFSLFFYRSDPPNYLLRQSLERRVIYIEMRSHDYSYIIRSRFTGEIGDRVLPNIPMYRGVYLYIDGYLHKYIRYTWVQSNVYYIYIYHIIYTLVYIPTQTTVLW